MRISVLATVVLLLPCSAPGATIDEEVDAYVSDVMAERRIPGLSLAVVRGGEIERLAAYGTASIELDVPVTANMLFHVASVTKSITAVGVMLLVESGEVGQDDSIGTHLPELPDRWQAVTVRQLLSHSSGLPDVFPNGATGPIAQTPDEALSMLGDEPMQFAPGARYLYTQTNYLLLGMLIERISGLPYIEFCETRLFIPADVTEAAFGDTQTLIPHRSPIYTPIANATDRPTDARHRLRVLNFATPSMLYPSNGLFVSAAGLASWLLALMNNAIIAETTLDAMMQPLTLSDGSVSEFPPSPQYPWRFSTVSGLLGVPHPAHPAVGGTGGPYAAYLLFPADGLAVVVLTNTQEANPDSIVSEIAEKYLPSAQTSR